MSGTAVALLVSALLAGPGATSASAAPACEDGSRDSANAVSKAALVTAPVGSVQSKGATITLRYSQEFRCAWGLIEGKDGDKVWIERSEDGGNTSSGRSTDQYIHDDKKTTYTSAWNVYPAGGKTVRACGQNMWLIVTGARTVMTPRGPIPVPIVRTGYDEIACTKWLPYATISGTATDYGIVASFFSDNAGDLPLRAGRHDAGTDKGFGIRHILHEHDEVPDKKRIADVLEECKIDRDNSGRGKFRCEGDGLLIIFSDDETDDGRPLGIITAYEP